VNQPRREKSKSKIVRRQHLKTEGRSFSSTHGWNWRM